jgi:hypothetical protein
MPGTIYALRQGSEIRYVGKTTGDITLRLRQHLQAAARGAHTYVARWLRSAKDVEVVVLECDPPGGLDAAERAWIAHLRDIGCQLTNLTDGGDGMVPGELAREAGRKGGIALRGKPKSPEHRAKIAAALRGTTHSHMTPEVREKIGKANTGDCCTCRSNRQCAFCLRQVN